jgi:uncharacterized protein
VIAVDTNILVYAHREDSRWHEPARSRLTSLAEGSEAWAITWPTVHEFLAIVTHPHIYKPPTPLVVALEAVESLFRAPGLALIGEGEGYWPHLRRMLETGRVAGPAVHDAHVAALCVSHGVSELWSADRDFGRFPELTVRNPLVA